MTPDQRQLAAQIVLVAAVVATAVLLWHLRAVLRRDRDTLVRVGEIEQFGVQLLSLLDEQNRRAVAAEKVLAEAHSRCCPKCQTIVDATIVRHAQEERP